MLAARRRGVVAVVRCGQGLRQGCVLASSLLNIFFVAFTDVAYPRFKADKDIMDALVHLRKKLGVGGGGYRRRSNPGDVALEHTLR